MFVGLASGSGESTDAWAAFLIDLRKRGLTCPLRIVCGGAKGLLAAIERIYPKALRQRCLIHRLRNVVAKIPAGMQAEIRDGSWAICNTTELTIEPGPQPRKRRQRLADPVPVRLPPELSERVRRAAEADDRSISAWVRRAVEHQLRAG